MGTEQCAVVVSLVVSLMVSFLNLKLWSRWFIVGLRINIDGAVGVGHRTAPVNRGTTESESECWLTDIHQCIVCVFFLGGMLRQRG